MPPDRDPHTELGVPPDATAAEIHSAFRQLLRQHHPDTRSADRTTAAASDRALQRIIRAYATLRETPAGDAASRPEDRLESPKEHRAPAAPTGAALTVTPVHWVPAAPDRRSQVTPEPGLRRQPSLDVLIHWLLGH